MKKTISILLLCAMLLCACGETENTPGPAVDSETDTGVADTATAETERTPRLPAELTFGGRDVTILSGTPVYGNDFSVVSGNRTMGVHHLCASVARLYDRGISKMERSSAMKLCFREVTKSYGSNLALDHFTASLEPGIYALLGPNGSGKSTLMNILTDNLKADAGEITYTSDEGVAEDVLKMGVRFREKLGFMPQYPGLYPNFTVERFMWYMFSRSPS